MLAQSGRGECPPLRIAYLEPVKLSTRTANTTSAVFVGVKMHDGYSQAVGDLQVFVSRLWERTPEYLTTRDSLPMGLPLHSIS